MKSRKWLAEQSGERKKTMKTIIVSRHPAAIEFIRKAAPETEAADAPVLAQAGPDDVRGCDVYGNLPLHLAALAHRVHVVGFTGTPPRGQEYTLADMEAAGAVLRSYSVQAMEVPHEK